MRVVATAVLFVLLFAAAHAQNACEAKGGICRPVDSKTLKACLKTERTEQKYACDDDMACCMGGKIQIGASTSQSSPGRSSSSSSSFPTADGGPGTDLDLTQFPHVQPSFSEDYTGSKYASKFCGSMKQDEACVSLLTDPTVGGLPQCGIPGHRVMCLELVARVGGKSLYLRWTAHFTYDLEANGFSKQNPPGKTDLIKGGVGKFEVKKSPNEFKTENWKAGSSAGGPTLEQIVFQAKTQTSSRTPGLTDDVVSTVDFPLAKAFELLGYMEDAAVNPSGYSMLGRNCADFAADLLSKVGYQVPWILTKIAGSGSTSNNPNPGPGSPKALRPNTK